MADKIATRKAYGDTLVKLGSQNSDIVVLDADLSKSTMTAGFKKNYPDRFFNMGIAEQNMYWRRPLAALWPEGGSWW